MFSLEGQVAIITGGAQGIGEGICKVFCNAGATVALWDVRDACSTTADNIKKEGGSIFFQKVDITDRAAVDTAVAEIIEGYGKIDILSNGFKCRSTGGQDLINFNNTWNYVYMAFAENPFKISNAR